MWNSMRSRSDAGTGVVAGSGTLAGSLLRSAASSQPGTREPCPKRGTRVGSTAIRARYPGWSPIYAPEDRVEHRQRRDEVGDVGAVGHRRERLEVHEARVAHMYAGRLGGAVGAHEAGQLAARALDRVIDLARRHAEALGDQLEVV